MNAGRLQVGGMRTWLLLTGQLVHPPPMDSKFMEIGDMPSVGMVVIDGVIVQLGSNTTLKSDREVEILQRNLTPGAPHLELVNILDFRWTTAQSGCGFRSGML